MEAFRGCLRVIGGQIRIATGPMEFLFGLAHGHFDASSARNASALDETSDQAIERVNTGIAVVVPFHIIDAVIASYEQKHASSERVQLEPDNIVNHWQWSRADAIRSAATVADTLSATLARYKTRAAHGQSLAAACLAATISDCLVAVIRLVDSHGQAHAPTLARGMIESMLDLEMVCANPEYLKPLRLATAQGKIVAGEKYLAQAQMLTQEQQDAVRADLRQQATTVHELKRQGVKPLAIEDKFKRAPKSGVLWSFYWLYCSSAHNDLRALATRHLREDHIVLGDTLTDDDLREILTICAGIALNVYEYVPIFLIVAPEELTVEWQPLRAVIMRIGGRSDACVLPDSRSSEYGLSDSNLTAESPPASDHE